LGRDIDSCFQALITSPVFRMGFSTAFASAPVAWAGVSFVSPVDSALGWDVVLGAETGSGLDRGAPPGADAAAGAGVGSLGASRTSARASSRLKDGCQPPRRSVAALLNAFIMRKTSLVVKDLAWACICFRTSAVAST